MPPFHPPSFPSQERVPLAEPAVVQPLPAEPKDPRLLRKAMAWTSGLMVAVGVASLCLGWVFNPGVYLDASGWQQLLAENLLPIFKLYFTESGEPPQMAAAHAAAAAAKQGGTYSHRDVFLALFGALSTLFTFFPLGMAALSQDCLISRKPPYPLSSAAAMLRGSSHMLSLLSLAHTVPD